jgi:hypothetical protein
MNNKLKALRGNKENFTITNDEGKIELILRSLPLPILAEITELSEKKENVKAMKEVVYYVIRNSFPKKESDPVDGITNEEIRESIDEMDTKICLEIFKKVMKLSGIAMEDEKKN